MKLFFLAGLVGLDVTSATNLFQCSVSQFYSGFNPSSFSTATALKNALHTYIDDHVIIPYSGTDEVMVDIDEYLGGVFGIYSLLPKYDFPNEWNREHVWPRSRGVGDTGADTSDLFNLFPCDLNLNSARGNKFYDECTVGSGSCVSPAGTSSEDAAAGSMEDSNVWAPPPSMRGDLARAAFYMAVRYDGSDSSTVNLQLGECSTDSTCGSNTFGRLSTLLEWHADDPPSTREKARNNALCNDYQGNRNPFIDFPELAEMIFGSRRQLRGAAPEPDN